MSIDAEIMNTLFDRLNVEEFNRVSMCANVKEICDTLEVTHEATNQVKESNINIVVHNMNCLNE